MLTIAALSFVIEILKFLLFWGREAEVDAVYGWWGVVANKPLQLHRRTIVAN